MPGWLAGVGWRGSVLLLAIYFIVDGINYLVVHADMKEGKATRYTMNEWFLAVSDGEQAGRYSRDFGGDGGWDMNGSRFSLDAISAQGGNPTCIKGCVYE